MTLPKAAALALALAVSAASLGACGTSRTSLETTTTGQELTDLKKAYDEGVISKSEYERKRRDILRH